MIYSVWDHGERRYSYYKTPVKETSAHAAKPKHLAKSGKLGTSPEDAAWPLPSGARLVGHGKYPKGQIATTSQKSLAGCVGVDRQFFKTALIAAIGYAVWRIVR